VDEGVTSGCRGGHVSLPLETPLVEWLAGRLQEEAPSRVDLSGAAVVFPGRRPALYLRRELGRLTGVPYFPPHCFDIDGFMALLAGLSHEGAGRKECHRISLVHLLYITVRAVWTRHEAEVPPALSGGFEDFFWAGLGLLDCFDEFGTELVPVSRLEIAVSTALAEAGLGADVRGLWPMLPELYRRWQIRLKEEGLWTRGEQYRIAASGIDEASLPFERVYLAGFAAITRAEEQVFSVLVRRGLGRVILQEGAGCFGAAGDWTFLRRLRSVCQGPVARVGASGHGSPPVTRRIYLYHGTGLHSQLDMASSALQAGSPGNRGLLPDDKAVILPRPEALVPVLNWLMEDAGVSYNISMGYPLERTPVARLLAGLVEGQEGRESGQYYLPQYMAVLRHPYVKGLAVPQTESGLPSGDFRAIVHAVEDWVARDRRIFADLDEIEGAVASVEGLSEASFRFLRETHRVLFRGLAEAGNLGDALDRLLEGLRWVVENGPAGRYPLAPDFFSSMVALLQELSAWPLAREPVSPSGLRLMLRHLVRHTRIPFHGTPLEGLQVLGFLETRCLHFRQVMMLDLNEGILPPERKPDPFLPPLLRACLGLPDPGQAVDLSRYHLHRLLAGAEEIHLFFDEGSGRTRSRFVEEYIWAVERQAGRRGAVQLIEPAVGFGAHTAENVAVPKDPLLLEFLGSFAYSATSIDTYLWCPLRFHARYVLGLDEKENAGAGEIDPRRVGVLVHRILRKVYGPWVGGPLPLAGTVARDFVSTADLCLEEEFGSPGHWSGSVRLFRQVLLYRLKNFLRVDGLRAQGCRLMGLELSCSMDFPLGDGRSVLLKGTLDRVERDAQGRVWVMDYKTGGKRGLPSLDLTFSGGNPRGLKEAVSSVQLPLYLLLCDRHFGLGGNWEGMDAALCMLKGLTGSATEGDVMAAFFGGGGGQTAVIEGFFRPFLQALFREILDPAVPVASDPGHPAYCSSCPYGRGLCKAA